MEHDTFPKISLANPSRVAVGVGTGHLRKVFSWGSFVTAKPEPADVDLMLVMSEQWQIDRGGRRRGIVEVLL